MFSPSDREQRRARRPRAGVLGLLVLGFLVLLAALSIPLWLTMVRAVAAKSDLDAAVVALRQQDLDRADPLLASARAHTEDAGRSLDAPAMWLWGVLPVTGGVVDDTRSIVTAMDDVAATAEIGIGLASSFTSDDRSLRGQELVDAATLGELRSALSRSATRMESARDNLQRVEGDIPLVGGRVLQSRDNALEQVDPAATFLGEFEPVSDRLPELLGFEGPRTYLVALLNPAELRYSGGAALSYTTMTWDRGRFELGAARTPADTPALRRQWRWRRVAGNVFHDRRNYVAGATFAPSWSVSGEELLRAWNAAVGVQHDGLIAADVMALADLVGAVGGLEVPGYGTVGAANLPKLLAGNYDAFYPDTTEQDALNAELLPALEKRFENDVEAVDVARSLFGAATSRHLTLYTRDDTAQEGLEAVGFANDLSDVDGDYLFTGTQNLNASKVDYYQKRAISLDVALDEQGTATNRMDLVVDNDTTPYPFEGTDPQSGYFTRYAGLAITAFLPPGVDVRRSTYRGEDVPVPLGTFRDHAFVTHRALVEPQQRARLSLEYEVPDAAEVQPDGAMTYRLAMDPQPTVNPSSVRVRVRLPQDYEVVEVPEGWVVDGDVARTSIRKFETPQEWQLELRANG